MEAEKSNHCCFPPRLSLHPPQKISFLALTSTQSHVAENKLWISQQESLLKFVELYIIGMPWFFRYPEADLIKMLHFCFDKLPNLSPSLFTYLLWLNQPFKRRPPISSSRRKPTYHSPDVKSKEENRIPSSTWLNLDPIYSPNGA